MPPLRPPESGQDQMPFVCGRLVRVQHWHGSELLQGVAPPRTGLGEVFQGDSQVVGGEDVHPDVLLAQVEYWWDGEVVHELTECVFHLGQP